MDLSEENIRHLFSLLKSRESELPGEFTQEEMAHFKTFDAFSIMWGMREASFMGLQLRVRKFLFSNVFFSPLAAFSRPLLSTRRKMKRSRPDDTRRLQSETLRHVRSLRPSERTIVESREASMRAAVPLPPTALCKSAPRPYWVDKARMTRSASVLSPTNPDRAALSSLAEAQRRRGRKLAVPEKYSMSVLYEHLWMVLESLFAYPKSWAFRVPVSTVDVPAYLTVIKKPMDLSEMRKKLKERKYASARQFFADIQLMCRNCRQFNTEPRNPYVRCGDAVERRCVELLRMVPSTARVQRDEVEFVMTMNVNRGIAVPVPVPVPVAEGVPNTRLLALGSNADSVSAERRIMKSEERIEDSEEEEDSDADPEVVAATRAFGSQSALLPSSDDLGAFYLRSYGLGLDEKDTKDKRPRSRRLGMLRETLDDPSVFPVSTLPRLPVEFPTDALTTDPGSLSLDSFNLSEDRDSNKETIKYDSRFAPESRHLGVIVDAVDDLGRMRDVVNRLRGRKAVTKDEEDERAFLKPPIQVDEDGYVGTADMDPPVPISVMDDRASIRVRKCSISLLLASYGFGFVSRDAMDVICDVVRSQIQEIGKKCTMRHATNPGHLTSKQVLSKSLDTMGAGDLPRLRRSVQAEVAMKTRHIEEVAEGVSARFCSALQNHQIVGHKRHLRTLVELARRQQAQQAVVQRAAAAAAMAAGVQIPPSLGVPIRGLPTRTGTAGAAAAAATATATNVAPPAAAGAAATANSTATGEPPTKRRRLQ